MTGPPQAIWCSNTGMTEPREPATLPKRNDANTLLSPSCRRRSVEKQSAAVKSRSASSLEAPITLVGFTALSELAKSVRATRQSSAARMTFSLPSTLVCTELNGLRSDSITCFRPAR